MQIATDPAEHGAKSKYRGAVIFRFIVDTNGIGPGPVPGSPVRDGKNSSAMSSKDVPTSFHRNFRKAEVLSSEVKAKFTVVTFKLNDAIESAYYGEHGQLLAVIHNIVSSQLPADLQADLKSNYGGYWITELFELSADGQSGYYIALENADTRLTLHATADGVWEVYGSAAKN
jgi:hypothetical protein